MKRSSILIVIMLLIGILVAGVLLFNTDETPSAELAQNNSSSPKGDTAEVLSTKGAYVNYSESMLADSTYKTKILFFHASWCPQCRELDESITSGQIPEDVLIIKIDYDDNQSLRSKYGITIQTTLVKVDDNGELIEKFVAYDEPTLAAVLENLL